jgi:HSP20 family molecular chaperone IbpA
LKVDALKAQTQQNRQDLKKLIRSQRGEMAARQQELKNIEKLYDKKKEDKRLQGEVELLDVADRNQARLIEASQGKEEKLAEMKSHILETQERLRSEEVALKKSHEVKVKDLNTLHSEKARDIFDRSQDQLKDLNYNNNKKIKEVSSGTQQELSKIRHNSKLAIDKAAYENDLKVTSAQNGQSNMLKRAEERFQAAARQQEFNHKNAIAEQRMKNQIEFQNRERINKDRTVAAKKHYDELIRSEKLAFEEKYKNLIAVNQQVLKRLKENLDNQVQQTVAEKSKELKSTETRQQDDFYHLVTLEPTVREDLKNYYIDIKTPPHEKENFNLTADKRTIRLSFGRRAEKRLDAPDGSVETSKQSQAITKEFKVSEIVDDKLVKVAYKDGVLSYRLPKA